MIDKTSIKILKILQNKARIPNVEVARKVGMAPSAVLERIRKLEKHGFIDGYEVRLNPHRFQRSLVSFIHIDIDGAVDKNRIIEKFAKLDEIQEIHFMTGTIDGYLLKARVAGPSELDRLVREQIRSVKGVRTTKTSIVLSTSKETARIPIDDLDII